ncbi:MAG: hypothetical protein H0T78_12785 [Longispora sp.]|nr:hypothetical protein [Longispora sp. (in: high G+C Gram-positive bacteria)]
MNRILSRIAAVLTVAVACLPLASPALADTVSPYSRDAHDTPIAYGSRVTLKLHDAITSLPVTAEHRAGYNRSFFPLWVDEDSNGCNTRQEVLIEESMIEPSIGSRCALADGHWYSYYDDKDWT